MLSEAKLARVLRFREVKAVHYFREPNEVTRASKYWPIELNSRAFARAY